MRKAYASLLLFPLLLTTAAFAADDDSTVRWRTIVGNINDPGTSNPVAGFRVADCRGQLLKVMPA